MCIYLIINLFPVCYLESCFMYMQGIGSFKLLVCIQFLTNQQSICLKSLMLFVDESYKYFFQFHQSNTVVYSFLPYFNIRLPEKKRLIEKNIHSFLCKILLVYNHVVQIHYLSKYFSIGRN